MKQAAVVYKDKLYVLKDGKIDSIAPSKVKNYRVGALIETRSMLSLSLKLPLSTPKDQLDLQVELKLYNEAGLDPNEDYVIDYLLYEFAQENVYLIEAFAITKKEIEDRFAQVVKKLGFIDVIFPRFIAYSAYYESPSTSNDLFIYLSDEEAFGAIYQNGKCVGFRHIDSLQSMAKKSGIELALLKSLLEQKGLDSAKYTPHEKHLYDALSQTFYKNIEKIVYAINFKRSYFGIDRIDRIFIDFEGRSVPGLKELFEGFGYIEAQIEPCAFKDFGRTSSLAVALEYVKRYEELEQKLNFTIFERKKPLYRFESFWLVAASFFILIAIGGIWYYLDRKSCQLEDTIASKEQRLQQIKLLTKRYKKELIALKKREKELQNKIEAQQRLIDSYEETKEMLPVIEQAKSVRQQMINDVVEGLYRYRLHTRRLDQNSTKSVQVELISSSNTRDRIAKFMDYLYKKGYKKVFTSKILGEDGIYRSLVKVER